MQIPTWKKIPNLITDPQIFLVLNPFFKDLVYARNGKHSIQMFSLSVSPIMPLGRDNYLSTLELLKGVSKSTQAVCLSGDFYSTTSWRWFCLLSPVDLLLSSSAAHYCSHKAARSGEREGRMKGGRGGEGSHLLCLHWSLTQQRWTIQ